MISSVQQTVLTKRVPYSWCLMVSLKRCSLKILSMYYFYGLDLCFTLFSRECHFTLRRLHYRKKKRRRARDNPQPSTIYQQNSPWIRPQIKTLGHGHRSYLSYDNKFPPPNIVCSRDTYGSRCLIIFLIILVAPILQMYRYRDSVQPAFFLITYKAGFLSFLTNVSAFTKAD